jgi:hypothetical protein
MFLPRKFACARTPLSSIRKPTRRYATLFEGQPEQPSVRTALPRPQSISGREKLSSVFDTAAMRMLVDYERSRGNLYAQNRPRWLGESCADMKHNSIVDADGNHFLDSYEHKLNYAFDTSCN